MTILEKISGGGEIEECYPERTVKKEKAGSSAKSGQTAIDEYIYICIMMIMYSDRILLYRKGRLP